MLVAQFDLQIGNEDAAVQILREAIRRWPTAAAPRATLAAFHAASGDVDLALQEWSEWLQICPDDDGALVTVAGLHDQKGDSERQVEMLRPPVNSIPTAPTSNATLTTCRAISSRSTRRSSWIATR